MIFAKFFKGNLTMITNDFSTKEIKFIEMWEELRRRNCLTDEEIIWFEKIKKEGVIDT